MKTKIYEHYAHGKLLLSGEYFVLDGAKALAAPCKYGQLFQVFETETESNLLTWKSYNSEAQVWFEATFEASNNIKLLNTNDDKVAENLVNLLNAAYEISGLEIAGGLQVECHLEFPNNWGLGSSSTLIASLADWFEIDAYELLEASFGGSGYDIACAYENQPLFYQRHSMAVEICPTILGWPFKDQVYFVHLGKKQNSREGIAHYRSLAFEDKQQLIAKITALGEQMANAKDLKTWMEVVQQHEALVGEHLKIGQVKNQYFSDFEGVVKSLGAWGGDFVMAASSTTNVPSYFQNKGYETILSFQEMIL